MLYITNDDEPGFIGRLGALLGESKVNIATFHLGRDRPGGSAIALVQVDQPISPQLRRRSPPSKTSFRRSCWASGASLRTIDEASQRAYVAVHDTITVASIPVVVLVQPISAPTDFIGLGTSSS